MQSKKLIVTVAFVSAFLIFSAPAAFAQAGGETAAAAQNSSETAAPARTEVNYESLVASMSDVVGRVKDYNAVKGKKAEHIQVVDAATLMPADQKSYDEARGKYVNFIQYLQNVTGKVTLLKNALEQAKVDATDVVAMDVLQDGKVVVFYDTRDAAEASQAANGQPAAQDSAKTN